MRQVGLESATGIHAEGYGITCHHANTVRAWVPRKPFGPSRYCHDCGEVLDDMNRVHGWLWGWLIAPFWDGSVEVEG